MGKNDTLCNDYDHENKELKSMDMFSEIANLQFSWIII